MIETMLLQFSFRFYFLIQEYSTAQKLVPGHGHANPSSHVNFKNVLGHVRFIEWQLRV